MNPQPQDLQEYYRLGAIARNTVKILERFIAKKMELSDDQAAVLAATLEQLAQVREGFQLQLRTSAVPSLAEMQYLVDRALIDWRWLEQLHWYVQPPVQIELPRNQLMAFAHAYISLAVLPLLPKDKITYPQARGTYADIPVPGSGAELLQRLEELERVIYRVLGGARQRVEREPLRRTYGFFESSAWLVSTHQQKFLAS